MNYTAHQSSKLLNLVVEALRTQLGINKKDIAQCIQVSTPMLSRALAFEKGGAGRDLKPNHVKEILEKVKKAYGVDWLENNDELPTFTISHQVGQPTWGEEDCHWYAYLYWQKTQKVGAALWHFTPGHQDAVLSFLDEANPTEAVHVLQGKLILREGTYFADICGKYPQDRSMVCLHRGGRPLDEQRVLLGSYTGVRARDRTLVAGAIMLLPYPTRAAAVDAIVQHEWPDSVAPFLAERYFTIPSNIVNNTKELSPQQHGLRENSAMGA